MTLSVNLNVRRYLELTGVTWGWIVQLKTNMGMVVVCRRGCDATDDFDQYFSKCKKIKKYTQVVIKKFKKKKINKIDK